MKASIHPSTKVLGTLDAIFMETESNIATTVEELFKMTDTSTVIDLLHSRRKRLYTLIDNEERINIKTILIDELEEVNSQIAKFNKVK